MKLIVGLGNPEPKYFMTRHNIGFLLVDSFCEKETFQNKYRSLICKTSLNKETVLFAKPQTYMNLSGEAVAEIVNFFKIDLENLLVIQDDVDQDFLNLKFQKNRGDGGHNGIKSIHSCLGTPDYARLKLGVGRSAVPEIDTANHVLSSFSKEELPKLKTFLKRSQEAVLHFIEKGLEQTANKFN